MSFIASIFEAIIDVVVAIVEAVIQVVEIIVQIIMVLLGWDGGGSQTIEYYEVRNVPLFDDVDKKNPLLNSLLQSILNDRDIASNLIYHLAFRSLKGNIKDFMQYIEDGNYFESFPEIESYILVIDYDELTAALNTLNGVPCTPEHSFTRALSNSDWVQYWLQENKEYNVGTNTMGVDHSTTSTSPITPAADTVTVTPSTNHFDIAITSEIATSDAVTADERWQADLNDIVYNSGPDNYTVEVYNALGVTRTLPYTIPTKPLQLHYVSFYYRDSAPSRQYLFVYKIGEGTYSSLDVIENPIDMDGSTIMALPDIPLRISNANYTTFGATKRAQIEELCAIIHLNAEDVLNAILNDPGAAPGGDLDHIYIKFGVRMWDTSQAGMSYLYNMFENLYPSQGSTQADYNNTMEGDDKPQNNIVTTTDDSKYAFQWSYITYEHTSLAAINADSGSTENGIYYSDMSRFNSDNLLVNRYYVSSGKGTYNVGYKADNLTEVAAFLAGSGVVNPGTTTEEAEEWLQVTERLSYNNPTPNLLESDGSASDLIYLTPDLVYENNGSGVLRMVIQASEPTTAGQSITYYCCKPSGLDAYTVTAPIGALRVVDGATGNFNMVKFNLGNRLDLMVPFIHTFIKNLSNNQVSMIFLAGAHASIYIAHYEVIHYAGMSFLTALVLIIIIIVIIVIVIYTGDPNAVTLLDQLIIAASTGGVALVAETLILIVLPELIFNFVVQAIIQQIIVAIAGDNSELAILLQLVAAVAFTAYQGNVTYGAESPGFIGPVQPGAPKSFFFNDMTKFKSISAFGPKEWVQIAFSVVKGIGSMHTLAFNTLAEEVDTRISAYDREREAKLKEIREEDYFVQVHSGMETSAMLAERWVRGGSGNLTSEDSIRLSVTQYHEMNTLIFQSLFDRDMYANY